MENRNSIEANKKRITGMATAAQIRFQIETALADRVPGALSPKIREEQEPILSGFSEVDRLQAFRRGSLVEVCGRASSGRTSLLLGLLSQVTAGGEAAALLDATDSFDPTSAKQNGAILRNLLWVRPLAAKAHLRPERGPLHQMLIAADIILQSGGFSLVILDLADVVPQDAGRIPLTTWFALRRAVQDFQASAILETWFGLRRT
jgi:RecA/RadA recombinase